MKKGINKIMSVVSIILCITILSSISTQVLAETIGKNNDETPSNPNFSNIGDGTEVGNIVSEITENRDKYTKHFRLDDGTFMAVNYVVPVHYKTKSGKWVEYNNSLVKENVETSSNEEETKYSNKKSNIDVDISTNSKEDELVSLNTSKGNISWKYVDSNNSKAKVVNVNENDVTVAMLKNAKNNQLADYDMNELNKCEEESYVKFILNADENGYESYESVLICQK